MSYELHRLFLDFNQQLKNDLNFLNNFENLEEEFLSWVMDFELDSDWDESLNIQIEA